MIARTRALARRPFLLGVPLVVLTLGASGVAHAEGSLDLPQVDFLMPQSAVYVDVLRDASEVIVYTGDADVDVIRPDGTAAGTFHSGDTINPDQSGAWRFVWSARIAHWDLSVPSATGGRLWSDDWRFDSSSFGPSSALNRSFYALVNGGSSDRDGVIEIKAEGLGGYLYRVEASNRGLLSAPGRSVPDVGQGYHGNLAVYIRPPESASLNPLTPTIQNVDFSVDAGSCTAMAPGLYDGAFTFDSNVEGAWHLVCDLDGDGVFNVAGDEDLHLTGAATNGANRVTFDGKDQFGDTLATGTYDCRVSLSVGELHYVVRDMETLYPGVRLFEYQGGNTRRGLSMFWNDAAVAAGDVLLPNGEASLVTSGAAGLSSGAYNQPTDPNGNSRAWGNFSGASKGNNAWMDTFTWLGLATSGTLTMEVVDGTVDGDGDTLFDVQETCVTGTDPVKADSDEDGLRDDVEFFHSPSDPLNPDSDGDCLLDGAESRADGSSGDYDADGLADSLDDDDDGDGIPTLTETCDRPASEYPEGTSPADFDLDDDGHPNNKDRDDDGDHHADADEGTGDGDFDGVPAYLDPDEIGNGTDGTAGYFGGGGCATPGSSSGALGALAALLVARRRRRAS